MHYYLYVSDSKLEMLYAQMPTRIRDKIATELKIDLKLISATFKEKIPLETRYQQLDLVREYLTKSVAVGSMSDPAPWMTEVMPMRWASILGGADGDVVYFGSEQNEVVMGLVGSRRYLVGLRGEGMVDPYGGSGFAPSVLERLESYLAQAIAQDEDRGVSDLDLPEHNPTIDPDEHALSIVAQTAASLVGPKQQLEFLAKRLLQGELVDKDSGTQKTVILATPLYVALLD